MSVNRKNIFKTSIVGPGCREQFLPLHLPETMELRKRGISLAGISRLIPPYAMVRQQAFHHTIVCTTGGAGEWVSDGGQGEILPDSVWLFPAGLTYRYGIRGTHWDVHWVHLDAGASWTSNTNTASRGFKLRIIDHVSKSPLHDKRYQ